MPVHPVKRKGKVVGYQYGHSGHGHKVFPTKEQANKQAHAIGISKARKEGVKIPPPHYSTNRTAYIHRHIFPHAHIHNSKPAWRKK